MLTFTMLDGWGRIPDFLTSEVAGEDIAETVARHGFSPICLRLGEVDESALSVEVYSAGTTQGHGYRFVAMFFLADTGHFVACRELPDVLRLLKEYAPLVEAAGRLCDRSEASAT